MIGLLRAIAGRVATGILQLAAAAVMVFTLRLAPGDPVDRISGAARLSDAARERLAASYGLDGSLLSQFGSWFGSVIRGDLGRSYSSGLPVTELVLPRLAVSLQLAAMAATIVVVGGLIIGMAGALNQGRAVDAVLSVVTLTLAAISPYISAIVLLSVFAVSLQWFPLLGSGEPGWDRWNHLALPSIALALPSIALVARTTRASLARTMEAEFVEVLESRGFSRRRIVLRHALRNAFMPVLTIGGLAVSFLIVGTIFVEYTFGLAGLGSFLVNAVQTHDYPVVQGVVLLFVTVFIVSSALVDLLYTVVDPRVSHDRNSS